VFDFFAHSPFGFWFVALLVIIFDGTLLLVPEDFTFSFGDRLNVKLRISENPYLLRHKEPIMTLFAHPVTPFFISSLNQPPQGRGAAKQLLVWQKRAARNSTQLTHLSLLSLVLVCIVGPTVSLQYGIDRALLMIIPALYVSALFGAAVIYLNRSNFGFGMGDLTRIYFELLICPILLVNIFKRIAVRQSRACTTDLINYFSKDQAEATRRLQQHIEATAQ
jgi:predicted ferric reductase